MASRDLVEPPEAAAEASDAGAFPSGFHYELPPDLIAQEPAGARDGARLLVVERSAGGRLSHSSIVELPGWLRRDDILVVNRSRVIPARLRALRAGGGAVEVLLIAPLTDEGVRAAAPASGARWKALVRPARRLRAGQRVSLVPPKAAREDPAGDHQQQITITRIEDGWAEVELPPGIDTLTLLSRMGEPPLPPYIRRPEGARREDWLRYQTVFADEPGSIAAPTAGLHLSERLIGELRGAGIEIAEIVLHVGPATFLAGRPGRAPLAVEPERYEIPAATRDLLLHAAGKRRIVAVGTTTTRALESAVRAGWAEGPQTTSLVLAPGIRFSIVDALLTNLHLPGSSLLALVSAFAGTGVVQRAYAAAVSSRYRFYSYGDAMLIL